MMAMKRVLKLRLALLTFLLFLSLVSCAVRSGPRITGILYEGKNYLDADLLEISRTKELSVQVLYTNGAVFTWKIDDVTLVSGPGKDKFTFKEYERIDALRDKLKEGFFKSPHQLTIVVSSGNKSVSVTKQVRILNEAPEINVTPDEIGPETSLISVRIRDVEGDVIVDAREEIYDTKGTLIWSSNKTDVDIRLVDLGLKPDLYILRVYARDQYGAERTLERFIRLKQSFSIISVRYESKNIRYYDDPIVVNRYGTFQVISDANTNVIYRVKLGEKELINLDSITTNATEITFQLKTYNKHPDVPWDVYLSSDKVLTLKIELCDSKGILQDTFEKKIKLVNEAPLVKIEIDDLSKTPRYAHVTVIDLEDDEISKVLIKLVKKGPPDTVVETVHDKLSWTKKVDELEKGLYEIQVEAQDKYGAQAKLTELFNTAPINEIERVRYEGQSMLYMIEPVVVNRTGEFLVEAKDRANARYTVKLDNIVLVDKGTSNKFMLKEYNSKLELSKGFFAVNHVLTVELYSQQNGNWVLQDSFTKTLKIENLAPKIDFTYNSAKKILTVSISDLESDSINFVQGQLIDSNGKVVLSWSEAVKEIDLGALPKGDYIVSVIARDEFGMEATERHEVQSLAFQNNPPSVTIVQPYNGERTPISVTVRWRGQDPDPGDVLRYKLTLQKGTTNVLTLETTSTEAVLPNLDYDTEYNLMITVYDLQNASATAVTSFKTVRTPRYAYLISKSFDGRSIVSIANVYNLPTVKLEGFVSNEDNVEFVDFDVAEDYIYAVGGSYLYVINASDKAKPKIVKKVDLGTTLSAIRIYRNYAIVGQGTSGICIVDVTNPSQPIISNKNFGKIVSSVSLNLQRRVLGKSTSRIDITQGTVRGIKLAADSAYIANGLGGLLRLDLSDLPNLTSRSVTLLLDEEVNDIDIGQFSGTQVIAIASGKVVKYVNLSDAESANGELAASLVKSIGIFDSALRGVKIFNDSLYAFTRDRIRKWINDSNQVDVEYKAGALFNDMLFVGNNAVVVDGDGGLITYQNDTRYEPSKLYKAFDLKYIDNFVFAVGDGFYCQGLYVIDLRDPLDPTLRSYATGEYFNKIDAKLKAVPRGSKEKVVKIVVANTDTRSVKLYDFDYTNLTLSTATPLTLTGYNKLYDVAIDAQGRVYVLAQNSSGNVFAIFDQVGNQIFSHNLPAMVNQKIPYFGTLAEPVEPAAIEVIVDYLSQTQRPSHVLVAAGRAGILKYELNATLTGVTLTEIPTTYYVIVEQTGGGYRLQLYSPGSDVAVCTDKYFDRIFVADGDFNGLWILDKNGGNLTEKSTDNLSKTPFVPGAPARNVFWYGDLVFVSGGGYGVKIVNIRDLPTIDERTHVVKIPFNGLTYAFYTEADSRVMVVGSDNGYLLYDISNFPTVRPISTFNLPMFKITAR